MAVERDLSAPEPAEIEVDHDIPSRHRRDRACRRVARGAGFASVVEDVAVMDLA